jgi:hypothetical protein
MTKSSKGKGFGVDFDSHWKEMLDLIEPATRFFLPALHQQVDWSIDYISLEQELRNLYVRKKGRVKRTDKLFRLKLLNGTDHYLLFHVETEAFPTATFPQRMFEYFLRLILKYSNTPITMLAIFVGEQPVKPLDSYSIDCFGTECKFKYNTFSVATQSEMELLQSDNPFALVILANLYVIQSKGDIELRARLKRKLLKHIASSNFPYEIVRNIFNFAVYFITLPSEEEKTIVYFMDKQAQAQPQAKKQTHAQKVEADRKNLLDAYYLAMFGKTQEDIMADIQKGEVIQAERATIQAERATIQAEKATIQEEKATIQEEKATIQEERATIQEERATIQEERATIQEERATIQEEKAMIQEEKATIQEEKRKIIVSSYKLLRMTPEEIAKEYSYGLAYVKSILAELPPETNK